MIDADFLLYFVTYFFMVLSVAQGMAFIIGYRRIHYLGFSVPVLVGGLTVSALTCRLAYLFAEISGVSLLPWLSSNDWVENSQDNAELVSAFLGNSPMLGAGLVLLSLVLAFLLAGVITWVSAKPALGLDPVYLAIFSYTLPSFFGFLSLTFVPLGGGHLGVFLPDMFEFSALGRGMFFLVLSGFAVLLGSSLYPRIIRRLADRSCFEGDGMVLFFGGGFIGVIGALYSLRYLFVVQANYTQMFWGWWPLLMLVFAGFGLGRRLTFSVFMVQSLRISNVYSRGIIVKYLFFPLAYLDSLLLGLFMIAGLMIYQKQVGVSGQQTSIYILDKHKSVD